MLELTSPVFVEGGLIPKKYTCDGENVNPELRFSGVPEGTKSLVLLMDDPDIPDFVREQMNITVFDHWVLFNIPATIAVIKENTVPEGATVGKNSRGTHIYSGPCPPDTEHRYFWKLFALDIVLELGEDVTKEQVQSAIEGHVLHATTLLGRYARLSE